MNNFSKKSKELQGKTYLTIRNWRKKIGHFPKVHWRKYIRRLSPCRLLLYLLIFNILFPTRTFYLKEIRTKIKTKTIDIKHKSFTKAKITLMSKTIGTCQYSQGIMALLTRFGPSSTPRGGFICMHTETEIQLPQMQFHKHLQHTYPMLHQTHNYPQGTARQAHYHLEQLLQYLVYPDDQPKTVG